MAQTSKAIHVTQLFAVAFEPVSPPRPFTKALEHPPLLQRQAVRHDGGADRHFRGARSSLAFGEVAPQIHDPTSMPLELCLRGPGRRRRRARRVGGPCRLRGLIDQRPHPGGLGPLPRQRYARGLFLAAPQVEHHLRPEAKRAHSYSARKASTASENSQSAPAGWRRKPAICSRRASAWSMRGVVPLT